MPITETDRLRGKPVPLQLNPDKEIHLRFNMLSSDVLERKFDNTSPWLALVLPITERIAQAKAEADAIAEGTEAKPSKKRRQVEHLTFMIAVASLHEESGLVDAGTIDALVDGKLDIEQEVERVRRRVLVWMSDASGGSYYNALVKAIDMAEQLPLCANDEHGSVCGHNWSDHDWLKDNCAECGCKLYQSADVMEAKKAGKEPEVVEGKAPAVGSNGHGSTTPSQPDMAEATASSGA